MTKKMYYDAIKKAIEEGFKEYQEKKAEYNELREEREKNIYNANGDMRILDKMNAIKIELGDIQERVKRETASLTQTIIAELKKKDALNPEELTADAQFLQGGLILTQKDIQAIIDRNPGNRTMKQLALRYAKEHGITIDDAYVPVDTSVFNSLQGALDIAVKWFDCDSPKQFQKFYDICFSPDIEEYCKNED